MLIPGAVIYHRLDCSILFLVFYHARFPSNTQQPKRMTHPFVIPFPIVNALQKWREVRQWTEKWTGFLKGGGKFRSVRSKWTTARCESEYSCRNEPKRTFPFDFPESVRTILWRHIPVPDCASCTLGSTLITVAATHWHKLNETKYKFVRHWASWAKYL